ncbi:MAG: RNA-binding S4 domain-containing protein [Arenicellales bacterium WSBS_2016_MAG_OTU3]
MFAAKGKPQRKEDTIRIDKWLWAARFFKTRQLAAQALRTGKIHIDGERVKPSRIVKAGDNMSIRKGTFVHEIEVKTITGRRVSAQHLSTLYEETADSIQRHRELTEQIRTQGQSFNVEPGRPTKRNRRMLGRIKRNN